MFREFDTDGSGSLSIHEFKKCLSRVGVKFKNKDYDQLIAEIDVNRDGKIEVILLFLFILSLHVYYYC